MRNFFPMLIMIGAMLGTSRYIRVEVAPSVLETEEGIPATFELRLKAGNGIHVNAQPAVSVKSDTKGVSLSIEGMKEIGSQVDLNQPIVVRCGINGLAPGTHVVKFLLNYTFCSDKEEWCRMGNDSLSIEVKVKK